MFFSSTFSSAVDAARRRTLSCASMGPVCRRDTKEQRRLVLGSVLLKPHGAAEWRLFALYPAGRKVLNTE